MADVTGRISTLPGSKHGVPAGTSCDEHPDRPAVHRVQGETDSMGSEMIDMCQECYDKYSEEKKVLDGGAFIGTCSRCGSKEVPMFAWRDYDEGTSGPVYYSCRDCKTEIVRKMNEEAQAEIDYYGGWI